MERHYEVYEEYKANIGNPNCILMLYVLDRAIRDLEDEDVLVRKEAVQWFRSWKNTLPYAISYKDIRDHIPLGAQRIAFIKEKISLVKGKNGLICERQS